jgi:hypothetical protein
MLLGEGMDYWDRCSISPLAGLEEALNFESTFNSEYTLYPSI